MKRKAQNSRMRRTGQRQSDDGGSWRQPQSGNGTVCYGGSFIVMAAGSIAVIPLLAANLDRRALGIAACVLTLVFWVGFIGAICCVGEIVNTPTRAFLLTSDWQLYYVHLQPATTDLHR